MQNLTKLNSVFFYIILCSWKVPNTIPFSATYTYNIVILYMSIDQVSESRKMIHLIEIN